MEFQWSPGGHFLVKQGIYQENVSGDIPLAYPLTQIAHLDDDDQNPQKIGQEKKVQVFKQIVHIPVLFVIKNEMVVLLLYLYLYLVLDATYFYCLPVIWIGC